MGGSLHHPSAAAVSFIRCHTWDYTAHRRHNYCVCPGRSAAAAFFLGFVFGIYKFFRRHDHYGDKVHSVKIHLWVFDFAAASTRHGWRLVMGGVKKSLITNDTLNMI